MRAEDAAGVRRSGNIPCSNSLFHLCSNRTVNVLNLTARRHHASPVRRTSGGAVTRAERARPAPPHGIGPRPTMARATGQKHPVRFYPASQPDPILPIGIVASPLGGHGQWPPPPHALKSPAPPPRFLPIPRPRLLIAPSPRPWRRRTRSPR